MNFLVYIMMWGWIPFNIILFRKYSPQKAILISIIGGILFLPVTSFDLPLIDYGKNTAIAISLIIGIFLSGKKNGQAFKLKLVDLPIIIWCIISPFISILLNGYGFNNAIFAVVNTSLEWGIFYILGRIYFTDNEAIRDLIKGIVVGGLIYVPLVLFEVRMSPLLSSIIYGISNTGWDQMMRYGGFRPTVFMNHGLMVAMWMAAAYIASFWLFKTKEISEIKKIPIVIVVILLLITTILCKCSASIVYLIFGTLSYFFYKNLNLKKIFSILILAIPIYLVLRISGILPAETILDYLSKIFNVERIESLETRLFAEEIFNRRALESPFFGWGGMDRAWPRDILTGESAVRFIDSLYLMVFSNRGFSGLLSLYAVLLLGPWKIIKSRTESTDVVVLSFILIFFVIDSLLNGFVNPVFILTASTLISYSERIKQNRLAEQ